MIGLFLHTVSYAYNQTKIGLAVIVGGFITVFYTFVSSISSSVLNKGYCQSLSNINEQDHPMQYCQWMSCICLLGRIFLLLAHQVLVVLILFINIFQCLIQQCYKSQVFKTLSTCLLSSFKSLIKVLILSLQ